MESELFESTYNLGRRMFL